MGLVGWIMRISDITRRAMGASIRLILTRPAAGQVRQAAGIGIGMSRAIRSIIWTDAAFALRTLTAIFGTIGQNSGYRKWWNILLAVARGCSI